MTLLLEQELLILDADITDNVVGFYAPITSSSYAVFDSGYKYMFDRFSDDISDMYH